MSNLDYTLVPLEPRVISALLAKQRLSENLSDTVLRLVKSANQPKLSPTVQAPKRKMTPRVHPMPVMHRGSYELFGEQFHTASGIEAMAEIFRKLAQRDDTFLERLAPKIKGKKINHLARSIAEINSSSPDLTKSARKIGQDWFLNSNISSHRQKRIFLREACKVADLVFGKDVKVGF